MHSIRLMNTFSISSMYVIDEKAEDSILKEKNGQAVCTTNTIQNTPVVKRKKSPNSISGTTRRKKRRIILSDSEEDGDGVFASIASHSYYYSYS